MTLVQLQEKQSKSWNNEISHIYMNCPYNVSNRIPFKVVSFILFIEVTFDNTKYMLLCQYMCDNTDVTSSLSHVARPSKRTKLVLYTSSPFSLILWSESRKSNANAHSLQKLNHQFTFFVSKEKKQSLFHARIQAFSALKILKHACTYNK